MSYMFVVAPCVFCGATITCNPTHVPSVKVDGKREPMCKACHTEANEVRVEKGLEPWPEPHPEAYEGEEVY